VIEKISYTGIMDGKVRPYIKLGLEKDEFVNDVETDTEGVYGIGIDAILYTIESANVDIFGSVGYGYGKFDVKDTNIESKTHLVNVSLGLGKKIELGNGKILTPYAGCSYLYTEQDLSNVNDNNRDDEIVPFAGATFQLNKNVAFGLEGNYIDTDATLTGSVSVQF
jgi:hypothetical protein